MFLSDGKGKKALGASVRRNIILEESTQETLQSWFERKPLDTQSSACNTLHLALRTLHSLAVRKALVANIVINYGLRHLTLEN